MKYHYCQKEEHADVVRVRYGLATTQFVLAAERLAFDVLRKDQIDSWDRRAL